MSGRTSNNIEIRNKARENGFYLWEVADALGITDIHLSRKMRYELKKEEREQILACIDEMISKRERTA